MRPQNGLLIFLGTETLSETKSWTSSRILTKKIQQQRQTLETVEDFACEAKLFHLFIIFSFFHFFIFSFISFSIIFSFISLFHISSFSFIFYHFLSFSFIFFHFLSFSFIFFHFLSFSLSLLGAQNLIFFWASISSRFLLTVLM